MLGFISYIIGLMCFFVTIWRKKMQENNAKLSKILKIILNSYTYVYEIYYFRILFVKHRTDSIFINN